jgi:hypothetical protein
VHVGNVLSEAQPNLWPLLESTLAGGGEGVTKLPENPH